MELIIVILISLIVSVSTSIIVTRNLAKYLLDLLSDHFDSIVGNILKFIEEAIDLLVKKNN